MEEKTWVDGMVEGFIPSLTINTKEEQLYMRGAKTGRPYCGKGLGDSGEGEDYYVERFP